MQRLTRLTLILAFLAFLSAAGRATAQATPPQSAVYALLQQYTLPASGTPYGYVPISVDEVNNAAAAAALQDQASIQKLVSRGRIDGLSQVFANISASPSVIEIDLALYRDAAGAQADLADTTSSQQITLSAAAPSVGDTSISAVLALPSSGPSLQGQLVGFTSGRLEVIVTGVAISGSAVPDLTPVTAFLAEQASSQSVPPPSAAELALLQTQTSPESILHDTYRLLLAGYLSSLSPATLLGAAFSSATDALSAAGVASLPTAPQITSGDAEGAWAQFLPAFQQLEAAAGPLSPQSLAYAAAAGMYDHLNCHTQFFTPTEYTRELASLSGSAYVGIGITRSLNPPNLILKVQSGTPADRAGLRPGDQILAVDHVQLAPLSLEASNVLFTGALGAPITLTIQRGAAAPFDVTMLRQTITPQIVQQQILPGGVGYIELDQFVDGQTAVDGVRSALQGFETAGNMNAWILDLRYDGGGSAQTLRQIASLFVPSGSLLDTIVDRAGTQTRLRSSGTPLPDQKPLAILVGPGTASAAELFTQALHDLGRATVVGSQTAGCVNGGNVLGFLDQSGAFLSMDQFLAGPNRVALEGVGVTPDDVVTANLSDLASGNDVQLTAAIAALAGSASHGP
jgi:carboxyl-terminal processing protease